MQKRYDEGMQMNKTLLRQALKFKDNSPTYSQTRQLNEAVKAYEKEHEKVFTHIRYGQRSKILDWQAFFTFLSEVANEGKEITSFEDIERLLSVSQSRQENIENTGDSKSRYIAVFDGVVIFKHGKEEPKLYKNPKNIHVENSPILAVENGETFLHIDEIASKFGYEQCVYLGGMSNRTTRTFLEDKEVVFFLDYDIEAIRIYDSFQCRAKHFFKPPEIEDYFAKKKYRNETLYRKQLSALPDSHPELQWLIDLIKQYSAVIEQEILR